MEKISLTADDNSIVDFYILDQQKLFGINYLLVADSEEGDGEALILKDTAGPLDPESVYEVVEDEREIDAVLVLFKDTLDELGILLEET
ncbi:MAG: DUF1292 domain-containing protein [Lachnospiraceae bacterium]|nr:DUF1292 domain-containing protein [Lachnospiraceae bacterium]MBQ4305362.1 DUF1292 domain-containing protein [Lachnospiraceae bacterium]MBQ5359440.1 DUF1292 domain-containing protein [Lachnospiraceae bacterium]